jgi:hypothetical protein
MACQTETHKGNDMTDELIAELVPASLVFKGQRIITLAMMDRHHQRPDGTARRTFNAHKDRLEEGNHYFLMPLKELRQSCTPGVSSPEGGNPNIPVVLLTQRGYFLLVKVLTDDQAWEAQARLVDAICAQRAGQTTERSLWASHATCPQNGTGP